VRLSNGSTGSQIVSGLPTPACSCSSRVDSSQLERNDRVAVQRRWIVVAVLPAAGTLSAYLTPRLSAAPSSPATCGVERGT
jgi:hypothetical protein